jgi:hypothetical protein
MRPLALSIWAYLPLTFILDEVAAFASQLRLAVAIGLCRWLCYGENAILLYKPVRTPRRTGFGATDRADFLAGRRRAGIFARDFECC